jgi:hypothetical protein
MRAYLERTFAGDDTIECPFGEPVGHTKLFSNIQATVFSMAGRRGVG